MAACRAIGGEKKLKQILQALCTMIQILVKNLRNNRKPLRAFKEHDMIRIMRKTITGYSVESTKGTRVVIGGPFRRWQWRLREGIEKYLGDRINRI